MKTKYILLSALLIAMAAPRGLAAVVTVSPNHGLVVTNTLNISPGNALDLTNNPLLVFTTPFATIYGHVVSGYNAGAWDGDGIRSSFAAADPLLIAALGCISNADAGYASFHGTATPNGTETFVQYTYYGDANLDGVVDATDYGLMLPSGTNWYEGDFNYDGAVNAADYALIDNTVAVLAAPEPASLGLLGLGALLLAARRRRA